MLVFLLLSLLISCPPNWVAVLHQPAVGIFFLYAWSLVFVGSLSCISLLDLKVLIKLSFSRQTWQLVHVQVASRSLHFSCSRILFTNVAQCYSVYWYWWEIFLPQNNWPGNEVKPGTHTGKQARTGLGHTRTFVLQWWMVEWASMGYGGDYH